MRPWFLLFAIFLLLSSGIFAQNSNFHLGLQVFPNYSNPRLIALGNFSQQQINEFNAREITRFSYSAGITLGWKGERAGIQFGLLYMDTGYRTVREPIPNNEPNPFNAEDRRFDFQNINLELPIELIFSHELNDNNDLYFAIGGAASMNLANNVQTIYYLGDTTERQSEKNEDDFRTFNYSFLAGMGWERALGTRFSLQIQPTFQIWLKGILNDTELNRNLYALGLKLGLKFFPYNY